QVIQNFIDSGGLEGLKVGYEIFAKRANGSHVPVKAYVRMEALQDTIAAVAIFRKFQNRGELSLLLKDDFTILSMTEGLYNTLYHDTSESLYPSFRGLNVLFLIPSLTEKIGSKLPGPEYDTNTNVAYLKATFIVPKSQSAFSQLK